jgi:L-ascorbate metabolism protein UlaG (beta-lactamase superfamily)
MHLLLLLSFFVSSPSVGDVEIVPITHASLILKWEGKTVHVDPWSKGDYQAPTSMGITWMRNRFPRSAKREP